MEEVISVHPCGDNEKDPEVTDILSEEGQRRLHRENQDAIDKLRAKLDKVLEQNEIQMHALRVIIGSSVTDTEALLRFRDEHRRLLGYDKRLTAATDSMVSWTMRFLFVGAVVLVLVGLSVTGILDMIKQIVKL